MEQCFSNSENVVKMWIYRCGVWDLRFCILTNSQYRCSCLVCTLSCKVLEFPVPQSPILIHLLKFWRSILLYSDTWYLYYIQLEQSSWALSASVLLCVHLYLLLTCDKFKQFPSYWSYLVPINVKWWNILEEYTLCWLTEESFQLSDHTPSLTSLVTLSRFFSTA